MPRPVPPSLAWEGPEAPQDQPQAFTPPPPRPGVSLMHAPAPAYKEEKPPQALQEAPKEGRKRGRKTYFTPEVRQDILGALALSATLAHAAQYAGISDSVLHDWLGEGRRDIEAGEETEKAQFVKDCEKATALGGMKALDKLGELIQAGDVKAIRFLLERRVPGWQPPKPTVIFQASNHLQQQFNTQVNNGTVPTALPNGQPGVSITTMELSRQLEELERQRYAEQQTRVLPAAPQKPPADDPRQLEGWEGPEPDFDNRARTITETENLAAAVTEANPYQDWKKPEDAPEVPHFMEGLVQRGGGRRKNPNQPEPPGTPTAKGKNNLVLDSLFEKT